MVDLGDFDDLDAELSGDDIEIEFEELDTGPTATPTGVGIIAVSEGLVVDEETGESRIRAYITSEHRRSIRIGSYFLVPYPDGEHLFCRVSALEYEHEFRSDDATEVHARRALQRSAFDELDYKLIATLEPLAILFEEDGTLKRRMTDRVPKPEAIVREATDTTSIKTGLKIPDDGIFVGHLAVGGQRIQTAAAPPTIDYRIADEYKEGDPLVFRHTLIAGGTGSGKTHSAKNVLRQYLHPDRTYPIQSGDSRQSQPAVVQFDPQDEYAQMHDDNPAVTADDRRQWEREGIVFDGHDDTVAFVPKVHGTSYAVDHHRAEQEFFTIPFSLVRSNRWLIAGGALNDNQYNALTELLNRFFDEYGSDGSYREFLTFLDDTALRTELDEIGLVHEATFDAVKRRVRGFSSIFDQNAPPITEQIHRLVRPGGLTVIPTYHVNSSRLTSVIVLAVASLLIDQKLSNDPDFDRIKETPLILGMDEAHNFLASADTAQASRVIARFTEAAKQGRKERLGLFLVTQDPQDIADPVFKQINTKIVLNLGDEDAISAVNIPTHLSNKVPYMEKGQMVIYSPDNSEPVELVGLPHCVTRHGRI